MKTNKGFKYRLKPNKEQRTFDLTTNSVPFFDGAGMRFLQIIITGSDFDRGREVTQTQYEALPAEAQWKAHNYNHLHEAPTVFYAVALVLALIGHGDGVNALIAWIYVGLRVIHSLVQATVNVVMVRFVLDALSSVALIVLIFHAAIVVFDIHI